MKKIFLISLLTFLISNSSFAQLNKGMWLTGGSASFFSYNQEFKSIPLSNTGKFKEINLDASLGYFVIDKLSLGLKTSFFYYKGYIDDADPGEISSPAKILFGPYIRYYFLRPDKPFNLLTDVNYQFGVFKDLSETSDYNGKVNNFTAMAGTEVFFNETAGLELLFGYRKYYEALDDNSSLDYSYSRNGLYLNIGFKLHLERK